MNDKCKHGIRDLTTNLPYCKRCDDEEVIEGKTRINDGGPAFPCDWKDYQPGTGLQVSREQYHGLTIRDYFAAMPLTEYEISILRKQFEASRYADTRSYSIQTIRYFNADAMIAERNK